MISLAFTSFSPDNIIVRIIRIVNSMPQAYRVYRKAGEWHIVDYKTNADGNALDVKYQNQLEAYKKAFEKITGEKVKDAGIYHIT